MQSTSMSPMMSNATVPPTGVASMHALGQGSDIPANTGPIGSTPVSMNTGIGAVSSHMALGGVSGSSGPGSVPVVGMPMSGPLSSNGMHSNQPLRELPNAALLCRLGQETVQEIVAKTTELFSLLKVMHPPNGTQTSINNQEEKKAKVHEVMKAIGTLFKRLRKLYEKCNEACAGMEYIQIESLIPLREDSELGSSSKQSQDDKKLSESVKYLKEEHRGYVEQLRFRNRHIKELIDNLRSIVWEINTMLAMRKP
ncbi:Mediator of RNA polymerase II transcription subunit 30-like protein [Dinothrombium tinctorium]|uniref:Mediator of RNA polymerase II transcription subunit 30 n=1 Tax=Dinothrombium tinctorium TaxID=1965070 RepID=A0A3S3PJF0_9ACAR|nr:Mediator of RNA polymerase II transcription subunit 30-like protein [Dinothrombium tinctorium]RWS16971.1 Mediator of RNA polymerase II transcription subunit 30-like protein [Dinothrombium tinctorium]RWS17023.1 Mediator of RNA polymerase II transcription subunit 30-like protein [Dinothrombium tinctorium]